MKKLISIAFIFAVFIFPENTTETARREYLLKLSDLDKKKQLITIKYKKIKEQNIVQRREEEKKIRFK